MICVVIKERSLKEVHHKLGLLKDAKIAELRLDALVDFNLQEILTLVKDTPLPLILTLRSKKQGGEWKGNEYERKQHLLSLASLQPTFIDVEADLPSSFFIKLIQKIPKEKIILSYHNFKKTPKNLDRLLLRMKVKEAGIYKIALKANSPLDALQLLNWTKKQSKNLIAVSMGPYGKLSRILGPSFGSKMTYACQEETQDGPLGQLSIKQLQTIYRLPSLSPTTALFGLIGDPVSQSIGDLVHNFVFEKLNKDAVYLKIPLNSKDLGPFLSQAKQYFSGLSVTIPHKEAILPFLDQIDEEAKKIGAVNTVVIKEGKLFGYNTDGEGAYTAIKKRLFIRGKKVIILGAGGAARAIAYVCLKKGAQVLILNRTLEKAHKLARELGCESGDLKEFSSSCDLVINCTSHPLPINPKNLLSSSVIMDIHPSLETPFLAEARNRGCAVIEGKEMFLEQALCQFHLWFLRDQAANSIYRCYS